MSLLIQRIFPSTCYNRVCTVLLYCYININTLCIIIIHSMIYHHCLTTLCHQFVCINVSRNITYHAYFRRPAIITCNRARARELYRNTQRINRALYIIGAGWCVRIRRIILYTGIYNFYLCYISFFCVAHDIL